MFEIINEYGNEIKDEETIKKVINTVIKKFDLEQAEFNIIFVDNEYIHKLNKEYRNVDRETDVITFALEDEEDINLDHRILGDVYISIPRAITQASEYGHSLTRELSFLTVHGMLHLLGYDHMEKEDEKVMFSLQDEILNELGIVR